MAIVVKTIQKFKWSSFTLLTQFNS